MQPPASAVSSSRCASTATPTATGTAAASPRMSAERRPSWPAVPPSGRQPSRGSRSSTRRATTSSRSRPTTPQTRRRPATSSPSTQRRRRRRSPSRQTAASTTAPAGIAVARRRARGISAARRQTAARASTTCSFRSSATPTTCTWDGADFTIPSKAFVVATGTTTWNVPLDASALSDGVSYTVHAKPRDEAGNQSTVASATFTYDATAPSVTINQAIGQADPTLTSPIHFTAVFSEPVTDFTGCGRFVRAAPPAGRSLPLSRRSRRTTARHRRLGRRHDVARHGHRHDPGGWGCRCGHQWEHGVDLE